MSERIFETYAPRYWEAGLQAIPLARADKIPMPKGWQNLSSEPVSEDQKENWLSVYPDGNIGLVLGEVSGVVIIDIDTDNEQLRRAIDSVLPPTPWVRRGRKGAALAYRYSGEKTFRIKDQSGKTLVECLSSRTQVVLPPSIHPDTKQPYVANSELYDPKVKGALLSLPPGIESILRGTLEDAGVALSLSGHTRVTEWVSRGSRDVQMVGIAGLFASGITRGELTFKEAIERVVAWKATCVEQVAGDDIDIEKGVMKVAEFLIRDVMGPKQKALPVGWDAGLTDDERKGFGFDVFSDTNEKWTTGQIRDELKAAFMVHDPGSDGRMQALRAAMARMVRADLSTIEIEMLLKYAIAAGQFDVSLGTLKKEFNTLAWGGIEGKNHDEIAKAFKDELEAEGPVRFADGHYWRWVGSHWEQVEESVLLRRISEGYGHLPAAAKAGDHKGVLGTLRNKIQGKLREVDSDGINFANGYLTKDLDLLEHHPDYGCTYTLPYRYMPDLVLEARRFREFVASCWGRDEDYEDKVKALQEALAVTFFGIAPRYERAFCLLGAPASGKSQMLNILRALMPADAVCAVPPDAWSDKFLPAQMAGKLVNICGELPDKRLIDGQKFKGIVSGELITGQHKFAQAFQFQVRCAHWFATNHIPRTNDTSSAFNRRWLVLVYNKSVSEGEKVLDLGIHIAAEEREAIVAWACQAMTRLAEGSGLTLPKSHEERIAEVARANNSLRAFLLDSGRVVIRRLYPVNGSPSHISETDLYSAYFSFALAAGSAKPVSMIGFRQAMRELGSEFGFDVKVTTLPSGAQRCDYVNITLASGSGVSGLRSSSML